MALGENLKIFVTKEGEGGGGGGGGGGSKDEGVAYYSEVFLEIPLDAV